MKKVVIPFILVLLILPTLLPFFNNKFFYTQDHIFIARLHQVSTALKDGHFPVRWAPDFRYGEPIFNFYAPLPYYLGAVIHYFGFDFIWVAKLLFILSSILSSLAMYIFCRKLFLPNSAILATVLYTYAPYRAVDIYVRGALSEAWAFVFFPLIFYGAISLAQKVSFKNISLLSLFLAGLFLTHNVTTLMFLPFLGLFVIYLGLQQKTWKFIPVFLSSFVLGLGLAAFFLLPALLERQFIQTKYLLVGYFDFRAHFVAFFQFFSTFWGYGSSLWGRDDGLSFQVGLVHWAILALAALLGLFQRNRKLLGLLLFLGLSFLLSIFLQHNKSAFIWEAIPTMAFIQFPWRFLAISIFIVSITGGAVADCFKDRFKIIYFLLITTVVVVNFGYFKPKEYVDDSFFDKFLNTGSMKKGVDLTKDYLPIWVQTVDGDVFDAPRTERGEIKVSNLKRRSTILDFSVNVSSNSLIEAPITYFPGWEVRANNQIIPQSSPSKMGLIRFELPKGDYKTEIEFKDTQVRTIGNIISLTSIIFVILMSSHHFVTRNDKGGK